uniref:Ras-associating domain-containing protein n=1 Tax=Strongyloides papillosus TaxID=174720 RepID=A0A0N5BNK7_STREA
MAPFLSLHKITQNPVTLTTVTSGLNKTIGMGNSQNVKKSQISPKPIILSKYNNNIFNNDKSTDINLSNISGIRTYNFTSSPKISKKSVKIFHKKVSEIQKIATSKPPNLEEVKFLQEDWESFNLDSSGKKDASIFILKTKPVDNTDFIPFDINRFLTDRIAEELDIDPKVLHYSS